ncbi:hypothetical protein SAMN05421752_11151 [Natronorubrum thiooxidans]|uniref:Uncharacterized protein n=1 Tax=Natronorubrum thiooxidans TaxID=308853 RepID=A0A1N7GCL0_9EURY|nr:hypothetical protein SAMN05421752_11151 [Natronorubrum thiooxidans]
MFAFNSIGYYLSTQVVGHGTPALAGFVAFPRYSLATAPSKSEIPTDKRSHTSVSRA